MRKTIWLALAVFGVFAASERAAAQGVLPVAVEVRGSLGFPMGDFGDDAEGGAESGYGFGLDANLALTPGIAAYAGWSRFSFPVGGTDSELDPDIDYVDSGFHGGLKVGVPLMLMGLSPWVRGGAVYRELEVEFDDADAETESTDSALGFEVGIGADIPLGMVISFTPMVGYVSYNAEPTDGGSGDVRVSYLDAGLGMKFRF